MRRAQDPRRSSARAAPGLRPSRARDTQPSPIRLGQPGPAAVAADGARTFPRAELRLPIHVRLGILGLGRSAGKGSGDIR